MRPRMSFALVTCITLLGGVCVQREKYSRVVDAAADGLCCTSILFGFFFSKEARQHTARRAVACVRTRSYRCVPFGSK